MFFSTSCLSLCLKLNSFFDPAIARHETGEADDAGEIFGDLDMLLESMAVANVARRTIDRGHFEAIDEKGLLRPEGSPFDHTPSRHSFTDRIRQQGDFG